MIVVPLSILAGLLISQSAGESVQPAADSLPFFYQRTIYLENLLTEGDWWANPSRISPIDKTTIFTSNVGLLGGRYSISSVRIIFPLNPQLNAGLGITGTGISQGQ